MLAVLIALAFTLILAPSQTYAADGTWKTNGNGNWSTASNWTGSVPSSTTDTATFGNVITANRTVTLDSNRSVGAIFFDSPYTYTISGSNTLTLNGTTGLALNGSGGAIINVNTLTLGSSQTWTGAGTGNVTVQNAIAGSGAALTKSGNFTLTLNGANTFSGGLTVSGGTTEFGSNTAAGSGTLTLAGGTIRATSASRTLANTINVTADTTINGSQALTLSGPITLSGGSKVFTIDSTAATTFSGSIGQQYNAGFTKAGSGQLILSGANTFTGAVNVNAGTLTLRNQSALGDNSTWGNTVASGATLALENNITVKEGGFTFSGTGDGGVGALRNVSGSNTLNSAIALGAATTFVSDSGTLTLTGGNIDASQALTLNGAGNITIDSSLQGTASVTKTGAGTLTYSGSSTNVFSGTTTVNAGTLVLAKSSGAEAISSNLTINNGGTVRLDASNQIKDSGAIVTVNQGGTLNLNNNSDAIAALNLTAGTVTTGTGTLTLANTGNGSVTTNASASSATISGNLALAAYSHTFSVANGAATNDLTLYATLSGSGNLIKTGAGTLAFGGASSGYTGSIFLNEGAISFLADNIFTSSTDLTMAGGTLFLNDTSQIFDALAITGNSIIDFGASSLLSINSLTIAEGSTLTITNWTQSIDYFYSQFAPGSADLSRIIFANASSSGAAWQSYDKQITPVPEPSTYGALLSAAALGLYFWHRKRQESKPVR
ncbi:MAG: autotransporter-associated beta strand repeat-containing protein [Nibricoccus sp.]